MELHQLRCFLVVAETLHFGLAAQRLDMLPSALGRHIRLLEESLGTRLFTRSTRKVALTPDGTQLRDDARKLLAQADAIAMQFRHRARHRAALLRIGTIDSAATGLLPPLLHAFRKAHPDAEVQLMEDKTVHLLPKLKSGRLDLIFIRPPARLDEEFAQQFLLYEDIVVAVPSRHPFALRQSLMIEDLANQPMIVPERRSRPHSYDLTMNLFHDAGLTVHISQVADEKQTIINLVSAELGLAIVPQWSSRISLPDVSFVPLNVDARSTRQGLPLAAVWLRSASDPLRDAMLEVLNSHREFYSRPGTV
ncbi:LysR family transcriptional regulator [Atlantibacter subterraneus]|uniref:LysR family transcriptional regulator n=1 Tax=Atlantibacter subterraneus TaxID=255519 RepID=UPI0029650137|nr:LysR family transcriptional regulator [Atlantibacter subterranea]MDW2740873.1 LysR family transcriptional regulator [Atlantibacter subterranea]